MICILKSQQDLSNLNQLGRMFDEITACTDDELAVNPEPAVISGQWLWDDARVARDIIQKRSKNGYATLLVPRFKADDVSELLGADNEVKIDLGDFSTVNWGGEDYAVSGVTVIETPLHAGRWAQTDSKDICVLAYSPHVGAGPIVICTADVCCRTIGVMRSDQQRLLNAILAECEKMKPAKQSEAVTEESPTVTDLSSFVEAFPDQGPILLLALVAAKGNRNGNLAEIIASKLSLEVTPEDMQQLLAALPDVQLDEVRNHLRSSGWRSHVRLLERGNAETNEPELFQ